MTEAERAAYARAIEDAVHQCNLAAYQLRDDQAADRDALGELYDPNSYGSGYETGAAETAESLARLIRALSPTTGEAKK